MNYLVKIIRYNDGTATTKSVLEYPDLKTALANCYKELGGWMLKANCLSVMCEVVDDEGNRHEMRNWTDEVVEDND